MKKDLNKLTFKELQKQIIALEEQKKEATTKKLKDCAYIIGENYLIRTVTMIYTGKLVNVFNKELIVTNCAWIPETKRWADTVKDGTFEEVEPYPINSEVIINREAILDVVKVDWDLPDKQK